MTSPLSKSDVIIVGAGIVGAAVARAYLARFPTHRVVMLEKEAQCAAHQTGRNSGVIHAGVYYAPGSLKARYCREGLERTLAYCKAHDLPYEQCGKIIVATSPQEEARLETLFTNCEQNDLSPTRLTGQQIRDMEPAITGTAGVFVSHTGITDYAAITRHLLHECAQYSGFTLRYDTHVDGIDEQGDAVRCHVSQGGKKHVLSAENLICCAGLMADTLIRQQGLPCDFRILPFRGEYFRLSSRFDGITERLIYPVPDPAMPFLGVHLTKMIGGYTTVGPNAVLASGREAYNGFALSPSEWWRSISFPGLYPLLWRFRGAVVNELKTSLSQAAYARQVQKYCPDVTMNDFSPYRSGIRAQAVRQDGTLMHDFHFVRSERVMHVGNAPSPAATSAMPIADAILAAMF
ncbi:L-2-hydroxyglutarate oxidase [Alteromonas sp. CYL-A6]|uniref:L-2-hydroxyglutarate oxidase n=1 Tax=Alteromonas nitratireducens TaxID=3390813 RepID=UPI0034A6BCD7